MIDKITTRRVFLRTMYATMYELLIMVIVPLWIILRINALLGMMVLVLSVAYVMRRSTYMRGPGKEIQKIEEDT